MKRIKVISRVDKIGKISTEYRQESKKFWNYTTIDEQDLPERCSALRVGAIQRNELTLGYSGYDPEEITDIVYQN